MSAVRSKASRLIFALPIALLVSLLMAGSAYAYLASGSAPGKGGSVPTAKMPAGKAPTVTASGSAKITVSFAQSDYYGSWIGSLRGGGYRILRSPAAGGTAVTAGGTCASLVTGSSPTLQCVDTGVPGGLWRYSVTPVLRTWTGTSSSGSNSAGSAPSSPGSFGAAPAPGGWTVLNWDAVPGATGYNVFRREEPGGAFNYNAPLNAPNLILGTTYTDTTSGNGKTYVYVVRAVISSGGSSVDSSDSDPSASTADADPPTVSLADPGANIRGSSVALNATASDTGSGVAQVKFQRSPKNANTWTDICTDATSPYSCTLDTTTLADGEYDLRALATDAVGNSAASALRTTRVDNGGASVTLTDPGSAIRGSSVSLGATASSGGSGVKNIKFQRSPKGANTWTDICVDTTSPYACTFDTTTLPDGEYDLRALAEDNAGGLSSSELRTTRVDNTAPIVTLNDPGANLGGASAGLSASASDSGSGVKQVKFQRSPKGTNTWTDICVDTTSPYTCSFDTTTLPDGEYDIRALVEDNAGGTTPSSPIKTIRVDNSAPTVSLTDPGSFIGGASVPLNATASDSGSGVKQVKIQRSPKGVGTWTDICTDSTSPYSCNLDATQLADGEYDLRAVAEDNAGNTSTSVPLRTTRIDNGAPVSSVTAQGTYVRGVTTLLASVSDAGSGVASVKFQYKKSGGIYTDSCTDTTAPYSCSFDSSLVSDGDYVFRVVATDNAGNTGNSADSPSFRVDNTAPTGSVTSQPSTVRGSVTLLASASDSGSGMAQVKFQYKKSGGLYTDSCTDNAAPYTCSFDTTLVTDGDYTFRIVASDNAGNNGNSSDSASFKVDNTAPIASVSDQPAGVRGVVTLLASAADTAGSGIAQVKFQYKKSGGAYTDSCTDSASPFTCSFDTSLVSDGDYVFRVVATDNAGNNVNSADSASFKVDNTAPISSVSNLPSYVKGSVTLSGSASDAGSGVASVKFQYRKTGGAYTDVCTDTTSPYSCNFDTTLAAGDGDYTFRAVATDNTGNSANSADSSSFKIDNVAPTVSVSDQPANVRGTVTLASSASDTGSGIAQVKFQYKKSGGAYTDSCTDTVAPYNCNFDTTGVTDGDYVFRAIATDNAGSSTTSNDSASFKIDNTAPAVSVSDQASYVGGTTTLAASASDAGSGLAQVKFQYKRLGGAYVDSCVDTSASYSCSFNTTLVIDGEYVFRATATDNAGNTATSSDSATFRVDNVLPTASVSNQPATVRGTVTLEATASDVGSSGIASVKFQQKKSGGSYGDLCTDTIAPYSCSFDTTGVSDGDYVFRVVATDNAGNATNSADSASFKIDNTAPSASLTDPGAAITGTVTLSGSASDVGSGVSSVVIQYRAAGTLTWTTRCPSPVAFGGTPPNYTCSLDTSTLVDGTTYDFRIFVTDNAGNTNSASRTSTVDSGPPTASVTNQPSTVRGTVTLQATASDGGGIAQVKFQYKKSGGAYVDLCTDTSSPYTCSFDTTAASGDGDYVFRVIATDTASNVVTSADSAAFKVDNSAPVVSVSNQPAGVRGTVNLNASASDSGSGVSSVKFQYKKSGGAYVDLCTTSVSPYTCSFDTAAASGDGSYVFRAVATDNAGNSANSADSSAFTVDNTAPSASVSNLSTNVGGSVTLSGSASDSGSGVASVKFQYKKSGGGYIDVCTDTSSPYSCSFDTTLAAGDGDYVFRAVATDNAGNTAGSADSASFRVDNTAPSAALSDPGAYLKGSITLSGSGSDSGSGVSSVQIQVKRSGDSSWTTRCPSPTAFGGTPPAYTCGLDTTALSSNTSYDFRILVTDVVGNSNAALRTSIVDNSAPSITLNNQPATVSGTITLSATVSDSIGSGVASAKFEYRKDGGAYTEVCTDSSSPYSCSLNTAVTGNGSYVFRVTATDNLGNVTTSGDSATFTVNNDSTPPSVSVTNLSSNVRGTVTLDASASDAGSGVASVKFQYKKSGGSYVDLCTDTSSPYTCSFDTTLAAGDGDYVYRAVATDNSGNTAGSTDSTSFKIDNTAPTTGTPSVVAIAVDTNTLAVSGATASDAGSGLSSTTVQVSSDNVNWSAGCTPVSGACSINITAWTNGLTYYVRTLATDVAGNQGTATATTFVSRNIIANAGFETAPQSSNWTCGEKWAPIEPPITDPLPTLSTVCGWENNVAGSPRTGVSNAYLRQNGPALFIEQKQTVPVQLNAWYCESLYVKTTGVFPTDVNIGGGFFGLRTPGSASGLSPEGKFRENAAYTRVSQRVQNTSGLTSIDFFFGYWSETNSSTRADDISVRPIPNGSSTCP